MGASKTATVETLTAEVRVLMVGSRQITLSVYGQLDWRDADQIEPFGRVRPKDGHTGWIYLIGRNPKSGELIRAGIPFTNSAIGDRLGLLSYKSQWEDHDRKAAAASADAERKARDASNWERNYSDNEVWTRQAADARAAAERHRDEAASHTAQAEALRAEYAKAAEPFVDRADRLAKLPLIVLAGLR